MIYVTHDQTEALTFADQVVVMNEGEVVQIGTPVELFERPQPHLRRPFHRLAGHERAALRGRGRQAPFRRPAGRDRQRGRLSRPMAATTRARRPAGIRQLRRRRHPGRRSSRCSTSAAIASSRRAHAGTIIKMLVPEDATDPGGRAHVRFDAGPDPALRGRLDGDVRGAAMNKTDQPARRGSSSCRSCCWSPSTPSSR